MGGIDLAANILGYAGNVAAAVLFLSPLSTYIRIVKEKSTKDFSALTYAVTWLNCVLWVFYGQRKAVTLIMTINGFGIVIQTIYLLIFLVYASSKKEKNKVFSLWVAEVLFSAAVGIGILMGIHNKDTQITVFGVLADVFNVGFCWAPLSVMFTVVRTKSVEFMPLPITLMTFANCACWVLYGVLKINYYIIIPNALGFVGAVVQFLIYFKYWKTEESVAALKRVKEENPDSFWSSICCCFISKKSSADIEMQRQETL